MEVENKALEDEWLVLSPKWSFSTEPWFVGAIYKAMFFGVITQKIPIYKVIWLVVEPTHLKNMLVKMGSFPQGSGWKWINNVWNHHLVIYIVATQLHMFRRKRHMLWTESLSRGTTLFFNSLGFLQTKRSCSLSIRQGMWLAKLKSNHTKKRLLAAGEAVAKKKDYGPRAMNMRSSLKQSAAIVATQLHMFRRKRHMLWTESLSRGTTSFFNSLGFLQTKRSCSLSIRQGMWLAKLKSNHTKKRLLFPPLPSRAWAGGYGGA